jgi:hypothetical protein
MATIALMAFRLSFAIAKETFCPLGKTISTGSGKFPVNKAVKAALAAAVAQAPVVQPLRNGTSDFGIKVIQLDFVNV